jgi:hypothetical protein
MTAEDVRIDGDLFQRRISKIAEKLKQGDTLFKGASCFVVAAGSQVDEPVNKDVALQASITAQPIILSHTDRYTALAVGLRIPDDLDAVHRRNPVHRDDGEERSDSRPLSGTLHAKEILAKYLTTIRNGPFPVEVLLWAKAATETNRTSFVKVTDAIKAAGVRLM